MPGYSARCSQAYQDMAAAQRARVDAQCYGHVADERHYFQQVEDRVSFRSVMGFVSAEVRAEREAEREAVLWPIG